MIARPLPYESSPELLAPRVGTRAGRTAVGRRRARTRRGRYAALARIFGTIAALVLVVVLYLAALANVTRMSYELNHLAERHARLLDRTAANDDAIANAESDDRLRADARALHMHEPKTFAVVTQPEDPPKAASGLAFLGWLK